MPISDIIQYSKICNKQKEQTPNYKNGFHQEIFNQYYALNPYPLPFKTRVKKYEKITYYTVPDIAEEKYKNTSLGSDSVEVSKICLHFKNMPKIFGYGNFFNSSTYAYVPNPYIQQIDYPKPSKMQSETAETKIITKKALKSKTEQVIPKTSFESKLNDKRSLELKTPSHSNRVGSQPVSKSEEEKFENRKFKSSQDIPSDYVRIKRKYTKENSANKENYASYVSNSYIQQINHPKSSDMKSEIAETEISTENTPKFKTDEIDSQTSLESEVNEKETLKAKAPSYCNEVGSQKILKSEEEKIRKRKFETTEDISSDQVKKKQKCTKKNFGNRKNNAPYVPNPYIQQIDHHKSSEMKSETAETEISTEKAPKSETSLESEVDEKRTLEWKIPSYSNEVGFQTDLKYEEEMIRKPKFKTIEVISLDQVRKKRKYTKKNSANKENNAFLDNLPSTKRKYRRKHEHKMETKEKIKRKYTKKNSGNTENNAPLDNPLPTKRKYRKNHENQMNTKEKLKRKYRFKNRQKRENPNNISDSNIYHKQNKEIVQYFVKNTEKEMQDKTIDMLAPKITISIQQLATQKLIEPTNTNQFVDSKILPHNVKKEAHNLNNRINEELNPAEFTNTFPKYHCSPTQEVTTPSKTEPFKINQKKSLDTQIYTQITSKETVNLNKREKAKQKPVSLMDTFPQYHLKTTQEISTSTKTEQSITDQERSTFNQVHTQTADKEQDNSSGINAELKPVTLINTYPQQPFRLTQELVTEMITEQFKSNQEKSAGNRIYTQTTGKETDNSNSTVNGEVEPVLFKDTFTPTQKLATQIITEQSQTNHERSLVNQLSTQSNGKEANGSNSDVNPETNLKRFTNTFLQPEFRPSQEHLNQLPTEHSKIDKETSSYTQTSKKQTDYSNGTTINAELKTARFMDTFPHFHFRPTQEIVLQITEQSKINQETFELGKKSTKTAGEDTNNFNTNVNEELKPTKFIDTFSPYNFRPEQGQRKTEEFKTNPEQSILSKISTQTAIKQTADCNSKVNVDVKPVRFMNTFVEYHLKPTSEQIETQLITEQCKSNQEKTFVSQTDEKENSNLSSVQEETGAISVMEKTKQQMNDHLLDKQIPSIGQTENYKSIMYKNSFFPQQPSYQKETEQENYNSTMIYNTIVKDGMLHNKMNYECDPRYSIEQVPKNTQGKSVTKQNLNEFNKLIPTSTEVLKFSAFCDESYNNKLQQSLTTPTTSIKNSPFQSITSNKIDSPVTFVTENSIDLKKHEPRRPRKILPNVQSTAMEKQSIVNSESFPNNSITPIIPNLPMLIPENSKNSKNHSHWKKTKPKEHYFTKMENKLILDTHALRYPISPINLYPPMSIPDIYHHTQINYGPQLPIHPIGCFCPQCCPYYETGVQPYPLPYPLPMPPPILSNEGYTNFNEPASLNAKEAFYCKVTDNDAASKLSGNVRNKRKTSRTIFTNYQLNELEKLYYKCRNPSLFARYQLANHLGLSKSTIRSWFSNKRNKEKILSKN